jgi:hypothetical protein
MQFFKVVHSLTKFEIATLYLEFPRLVNDPQYAFRRMGPLMADHAIDEPEYMTAHANIARSNLIHDFGAAASATNRPYRAGS